MKSIIYFDSKTGNVKRFVENVVSKRQDLIVIDINDHDHFVDKGHLITYTTGRGEVPVTTKYFLERYSSLIKSISASGNKNWGSNFALSADTISKTYNLPILIKFELSGFDSDVTAFLNQIDNIKSFD